VINIEKILELIESYVGISKIEKDIHGEVFTKLETVNEMLDLLPFEIWSNPTLKWLDPCAGIGNFQMVIIQRLMKGLERWELNDELRFKHIVENMIYTCDIQPKNTYIYLQLFDPNHEYKLNWYRGSFLDEGFDKKMKEWGIDKFDIGIGNPPYTHMIDMDFVLKSYDICDKVLFVHPSTWLLDEKNKQKKFIKVKDKIGKHLEKIVLFNGNKIFNIALFVPCVYTYINKKKEIEGIECVDKLLNKNVHYNNIYEINKFSDVDIYPKLKEKILKKSNIDNLDNLDNKKIFNISTKRNNKPGKVSRYKDLNTIGDYYINIAQIRGNVNLRSGKVSRYKDLNTIGDYYINIAQIRGHVNLRSGLYMVQDDFYTIVSRDNMVDRKIDNHMFFLFKSDIEANNFLNYIKTNFVRFCLSINKNNSQLECGEMSVIPWLDFSKEWNDEKLYKYFNLSEDEIKFIEKIIPNYYD